MMNIVFTSLRLGWRFLLLSAIASLTVTASAQVPVDEHGNPVQPLDDGATVTAEGTTAGGELMTPEELEVLVGPIALYPDDLLAIVLPASTYPLEIVQAARFLEEQAENEDLQPDESWDDSIVALLNYPEVLQMMNEDIDWTWRLGEAVANQQPDVINAVETFRDRAYAAGNLKSDDYQTVTETDQGVIEIEPVSEEIIYVPYYEPERVVVYQPRPVYYYYPRPYPVYYYPYPHGYNFYSNYFWGVTTAFTIGWTTNHLHVFHHSYWGHPYYGHTYYPHWWYRRPSITVYNTWYGDRRSERTRDHYANGDFWRPRHTGGARPGFHRSRADYYRDRQRQRSSEGYSDRFADGGARIARAGDRQVSRDGRVGFRGEDNARTAVRDRASGDNTIRFRERDGQPATRFTGRERAAGIPDDGRRTITTERASERDARDNTRGITRERATQRMTPPADTNRQSSSDRERLQPNTTRRETATPPVTRTPTVRTESPRRVITPAPRATAPSRPDTARSTPRVSSPSSSAPRSVSRPAASSAPRSVSRPTASSAPRSVSRPAASSAPRSVSRPVASSAPRSVSRPAASSAPRSVSRPSVSAPRSVSRPSASAARAPAARPSSSSHSARRAESSSGGTRRQVRQR